MIKIDVKVLSVTPQVQHHLLRGAYRYLQSTAGIDTTYVFYLSFLYNIGYSIIA